MHLYKFICYFYFYFNGMYRVELELQILNQTKNYYSILLLIIKLFCKKIKERMLSNCISAWILTIIKRRVFLYVRLHLIFMIRCAKSQKSLLIPEPLPAVSPALCFPPFKRFFLLLSEKPKKQKTKYFFFSIKTLFPNLLYFLFLFVFTSHIVSYNACKALARLDSVRASCTRYGFSICILL